MGASGEYYQIFKKPVNICKFEGKQIVLHHLAHGISELIIHDLCPWLTVMFIYCGQKVY
jgi:hypothetical protein